MCLQAQTCPKSLTSGIGLYGRFERDLPPLEDLQKSIRRMNLKIHGGKNTIAKKDTLEAESWARYVRV